MDPMFQMQIKYVLENPRLTDDEKMDLSRCFDMAHALGIQKGHSGEYLNIPGLLEAKITELKQKLKIK